MIHLITRSPDHAKPAQSDITSPQWRQEMTAATQFLGGLVEAQNNAHPDAAVSLGERIRIICETDETGELSKGFFVELNTLNKAANDYYLSLNLNGYDFDHTPDYFDANFGISQAEFDEALLVARQAFLSSLVWPA